jgi:hypothetical protein
VNEKAPELEKGWVGEECSGESKPNSRQELSVVCLLQLIVINSFVSKNRNGVIDIEQLPSERS